MQKIRIFPKLPKLAACVAAAAAMTITAIPMTLFAAPNNVDCGKMLSIVDKVKPVDTSLDKEENASLDGGLLIEKGKATIVGLSDDAGENGFEINEVKIADEKVAKVVEELPEEAKNDPSYEDWQKQIKENEGAVILWGESNGSVKMDFNITNPSWKAACTDGCYRDVSVEVKAETVPAGTKAARVAEAVREARAAIAAAAQQALTNSAGQNTPSLTLPKPAPNVPGVIQPTPDKPSQTPDVDNGSGNGGSNSGTGSGSGTGSDGNTPSNPSNPSTPDNSGSGDSGNAEKPPVYDSPVTLPPGDSGSGSGNTGGSGSGNTGDSTGNTGGTTDPGNTGGSGSGDSGEELPEYPSPYTLPKLESRSAKGSTPAKAKAAKKAVLSDDNDNDANDASVDDDVANDAVKDTVESNEIVATNTSTDGADVSVGKDTVSSDDQSVSPEEQVSSNPDDQTALPTNPEDTTVPAPGTNEIVAVPSDNAVDQDDQDDHADNSQLEANDNDNLEGAPEDADIKEESAGDTSVGSQDESKTSEESAANTDTDADNVADDDSDGSSIASDDDPVIDAAA